MSPNDYRRDPRGFLVRVTPKTFRRGRIHWTGGRAGSESAVPTGGKKGLTRDLFKWVSAKMVDPARVKVHRK